MSHERLVLARSGLAEWFGRGHLWMIWCGCSGRRCGLVGWRFFLWVVPHSWRVPPRTPQGQCWVSWGFSTICPSCWSVPSSWRFIALWVLCPSWVLWSCGPTRTWIFIVIGISFLARRSCASSHRWSCHVPGWSGSAVRSSVRVVGWMLTIVWFHRCFTFVVTCFVISLAISRRSSFWWWILHS